MGCLSWNNCYETANVHLLCSYFEATAFCFWYDSGCFWLTWRSFSATSAAPFPLLSPPPTSLLPDQCYDGHVTCHTTDVCHVLTERRSRSGRFRPEWLRLVQTIENGWLRLLGWGPWHPWRSMGPTQHVCYLACAVFHGGKFTFSVSRDMTDEAKKKKVMQELNPFQTFLATIWIYQEW